MSQQTTTAIDVADFRNGFLTIWRELFEPVTGGNAILDHGTSLFETLADISAEEANIPVSKQSASLAAQVQHTAFFIEVTRDGAANNWADPVDWDGSWRIDPVDDAGWQALIDRLRAAYDWATDFATQATSWEENYIGGAFALIGHAAYHLGEIRQGIGVIRSGS